MIKPLSIDQMWQAFVIRVKLQPASEIQRTEMEMAFKAGCAAVLMEQLTSIADLPEEVGVRTLQRWRQEINDYLTKRVQEYKARGGH